MTWGAAIASICALLLPLLQLWLSKSPERKKEAQNEAIQDGRKAIVEGDVAGVNSRVDRLLPSGDMPTEAARLPTGASGQHSDANIAQRLNDVLKP